jgi:membrane protease YdiL (CAAX protease family)
MLPAMIGAIPNAASVELLLAAFKAPLAASVDGLRYADIVLMVVGAALALQLGYAAIARRRSLLGAADLQIPPPMPAEFVVAPMMAYLVAAALMSPLLARLFGESGQPHEPSYSGLLATHAALVAGGLASVVVLRRVSTDADAANADRTRPWVREALVGLLVALAVCQGLLHLTRQIVLRIDPQHAFHQHTVLEALQRPNRPAWLPAAMWIGVTVIAPAAEELFFRGVLLTAFLRATRRRALALTITSVFFGLAHFQQVQDVPALAAFGAILGALYLRTRSLKAPILVHALFNAKTMLWLALGAPA